MDDSIRKLVPVYVLVFLRGFSLSLTINGPVMPLYARSLGVSVSQWSFLATSLAVGFISFEAFWGSMSDRVDRIRILVLSMLLMSCVLPLYTMPNLLPRARNSYPAVCCRSYIHDRERPTQGGCE